MCPYASSCSIPPTAGSVVHCPTGRDGVSTQMRFAFGEYELDTETRTLLRGKERIPVQAKVFDLLAYLIEHRDRVASTDELFEALWPGVNVGPAALSRAVHKAREVVGDDGEHQTILSTEYGRGFRFVADATVVAPADAVATPPSRPRVRLAALAGVAATLLVVVIAWLLARPLAESAPARSVAVMPFANVSQEPAAEPFANGIYDDILTHVSKIRDLKVIARTTMEQLDPNLGIREIGTKLGVAAVLEGGVQRAGDRVRINVQLIDCETEAHLWAENYDRELTAANIFAIQREIAMSVAEALRAKMSAEEQDRIATAPTANLAAYQAYLLGKHRMAKGTTAAMLDAMDYFQQAIELDPNFALAYVGLADTYIEQADRRGLKKEKALAKAQAATEKALALDDRLGEAYNSLAGIKDEQGDLEGAEATYQRALELNPNYATAYHWYGILLRQLDRPEEALAFHLRAIELDPLSAVLMVNVADDLRVLGRFEESLAWLEDAVEIEPGFSGSLGFHHLEVSGRLDEAVVWFVKAMALDPGNPNYPAQLGLIFLNLGDPGEAKYWIERSIGLGPENFWPNHAMQILHLYQGEEEAIFDYARRYPPDSPGSNVYLFLLRNQELSAGRYAEARALYEEAYPELLNEDDPTVGHMNWKAAVDLALVLAKTGEQDRADLLLDRAFEFIQIHPRRDWYWWAQWEIYAVRGEKQKALAALRRDIDEGWRSDWWYDFKHDPNLESLRGEPEFRAMREEIEADMAAQLERVRQMERNGELAAIPRSEVSLH